MNNSALWQWQTVAEKSFLTCNLLSTWQHGFFTKEYYPQSPEELTSILQPQTNAYRVKQVHGNAVLTTQEIDRAIAKGNLNHPFPDADAVIGNLPQQSVWAASADCTPILIGDLQTGRVCAIHAGWRGTAQEIVKVAIARFLELGSKLDDLRVAIGPAIGGAVYQVDEAVAIELGRTIVTNSQAKSGSEVLQALWKMPHSPILADDLPGKVRLNVPKVNQLQLEQLGIDPDCIAIASDFCTYQHDRFFSYRRTGEKKVQWSGIVSR